MLIDFIGFFNVETSKISAYQHLAFQSNPGKGLIDFCRRTRSHVIWYCLDYPQGQTYTRLFVLLFPCMTFQEKC